MRGRVQGIGYRWFVREQAERLGVAGWTRNLPDGTVEIEAEAEESKLRRLAARLKAGHPYARVDGLDEDRIERTGEAGFEIRG